MEKSRTKVHDEDTQQIDDLREALSVHCQQNEKHDLATDGKLDQLMWLADPEFKQTLQSIIDDRKANTIIAAKIIKWIGVIGAILGLIWGGIQIWRAIK